MAETKKSNQSKPAQPKVEYVTKTDFDNAISSIADLIEKIKVPAPAADPIKEVEIAKAEPNTYSFDEEWDEIARTIIGEAVDHTEVERKGGGVKFTVVIKNEFSNASKEYLERTKVDRRTREVGAEGTEGVTLYCKLVKANLNRPNQR